MNLLPDKIFPDVFRRALACALTFCLVALYAPPAHAAGARVIRVAVAVTDVFRQDPAWKETFQRRLDYASKIFENEFKLKFKIVRIDSWSPPEGRQDSAYLIDDLTLRFPVSSDIDLVVGLTRLTDPKLLKNIADFDTLGIARPFSGYVLLRYPMTTLFKIQQETVLTHELGHAFGAIHTNKPETIMSPIVQYQIPTAFDAENREIISLTRKMDFRRGLESLPAAEIQRLLGSYLKLMAFGQGFDFYYSLGVFYLRLGQTDDTLRAWEKAADIDPENARIDYDLGTLYMKRGQQDLAIQKLNTAVRKLSHPALVQIKADALNMLGNTYFQKNAVEAAYHAWSGAAAIRPKDQGIKANLALVQLMMGKTGEAIRMLEEVVRANPNDAKALGNLGYAYFKKGNYPQALQYLTRTLKLSQKQTIRGSSGPFDPSQPSEIHKNLAFVYLKMNDKKKAVEHFQISCQQNPGADCMKNLGYLYYEQGDFPKAAGALASVVAQGSTDDPQIYGMLGASLAQMKDDAKAIAAFEEGIKRVSDKKILSLFHQNIANLYVQHEQWDTAVHEFNLALSNDWSNTTGHYGLGIAYIGQGRYKEALQSLNNVLRLDPKNAAAKKLIANVEKALAPS